MELSSKLQTEIVNFLKTLPNIDDSDGQRALLYHAGLDQQLRGQIPFGKPAAEFAPLLILILSKYGLLKDGRNALEAVLVTIKDYDGQERKAYCDRLIETLRTELELEDVKDSNSSKTQKVRQNSWYTLGDFTKKEWKFLLAIGGKKWGLQFVIFSIGIIIFTGIFIGGVGVIKEFMFLPHPTPYPVSTPIVVNTPIVINSTPIAMPTCKPTETTPDPKSTITPELSPSPIRSPLYSDKLGEIYQRLREHLKEYENFVALEKKGKDYNQQIVVAIQNIINDLTELEHVLQVMVDDQTIDERVINNLQTRISTLRNIRTQYEVKLSERQ